LAVLHSETASTTQQPRGEHRGTIKDCKIAGATTWQGQGNHTFTTPVEIHGLVAMMLLTIWVALSSMKELNSHLSLLFTVTLFTHCNACITPVVAHCKPLL